MLGPCDRFANIGDKCDRSGKGRLLDLHLGFSIQLGHRTTGKRDKKSCPRLTRAFVCVLSVCFAVRAAEAQSILANGSFEQNFTGWSVSGNQDIATGTATQGSKCARFNAANKPPNAVLSQSLSTTPGQSYTLSFDYGVYSPVSLRQQRLQVTVQGNNVPVSQLISQSAFNVAAVQYVPNVFSFIADSTVTTLTFSDVSLSSDSVDSYVDNVQVR